MFVAKLQRSVKEIKQSRRMGERYMLTELLMQDERRTGRMEGRIIGYKEAILESLMELGDVSDSVSEKIMQETELEQLKLWVKLAARVDSFEQFMEKM